MISAKQFLIARLGIAFSSQHGVISRHQVEEAGGGDNFIRWQLSVRHWARARPGVYTLRGVA